LPEVSRPSTVSVLAGRGLLLAASQASSMAVVSTSSSPDNRPPAIRGRTGSNGSPDKRAPFAESLGLPHPGARGPWGQPADLSQEPRRVALEQVLDRGLHPGHRIEHHSRTHVLMLGRRYDNSRRLLRASVELPVRADRVHVTGIVERRRLRRRAGASALREYEKRKKDWQRQHRRFFRTMSAIACVVAAVTAWLARGHLGSWIGGVVAGMVLAMVVIARETTPQWIDNYQRGAWGEQRTAKAVEPLLARGWVVLHDLKRHKSNVDHVIVGPGGVFILDTKNNAGTAQATGDRLRIARPDGKPSFEDDRLATAARRQGAQLHDLIKDRCGVNIWVDALIVLWAEFPQAVVEGRNMAYVHGDRIVDWLLSRRARLNAAQIDQIVAALQPGRHHLPAVDDTRPRADRTRAVS
jgi:hypothetical protein